MLQYDSGYALFDADPDNAQDVLRRALELGPVTSFARTATHPHPDLQGGRRMSGTATTAPCASSISFTQAVTLVAGREIKMRLRSKAFVISAGILLLAVLAS